MTDPTTKVPNPVGLAFRRRRRTHLLLIAAWVVAAIGFGVLSRDMPHATILDGSFAALLVVLIVADILVWRCPRCGRLLLARGTAFPLFLPSCPGCGADFEP